MRFAASCSRLGIATPTRPEPGGWVGTSGAEHPDPFAVNPIRRSSVLVAVSAIAFFGPLAVGGQTATTAMLAGGWLGMTGLAFGVPVLALSLAEEGWRRLYRRRHPSLDQLDLPARLRHVLHRHGYDSIPVVERTPDAALLLLSNLDARGVHEIRRAIALWRYRRWQERGFP